MCECLASQHLFVKICKNMLQSTAFELMSRQKCFYSFGECFEMILWVFLFLNLKKKTQKLKQMFLLTFRLLWRKSSENPKTLHFFCASLVLCRRDRVGYRIRHHVSLSLCRQGYLLSRKFGPGDVLQTKRK